MAFFEVEHNGKTFEVEAPDMNAAMAALGALPKPSITETAVDVAKSAGVGVGKGLIGLGGMIGDLSDLGAKGLEHATNFVSDKLGVERYQRPSTTSALHNIPTNASLTKNVQDVTGEFYKPQTTAGKYAETVGEFAPAIVGGPGGLARRGLTQVAAPGIASEAAGQATQGTAAEPYARLAAAVAAPMGVGAASRVITPAPSSEARQRLVEILQGEGVTSLTAGQRTGNKTLQYAESILGDAPGAGQGASRIQQEGQRQFTEAAMRRAGQNLPDATPEVLAQNNTRLGNEFQQLAARNDLTPDNQFITDITNAVGNYRRVPDSQQRQMVQGYIDDIVPHVNAGQMPGREYQEMRSRLSRQSKSLQQSDPTLSEALRDMRNALDNAMGRSISPADQQAWQTARREYGAQKTLEKSASRAGEEAAEGQIKPSSLRNTVAANNRGAYARGEGDFSELARAGSGVMAPLPNSGTGQRNQISNMASYLSGMAGGGAGAFAGPGGAMAGMAAGLAVPGAVGRALMSGPMQAYLSNQLLALPVGDRQRVLAALLRGNATLPAMNNPNQIEGPRQ